MCAHVHEVLVAAACNFETVQTHKIHVHVLHIQCCRMLIACYIIRCKYTVEFIVYAIQWERYSFKLLIFIVCFFSIDGLIQLCDYRGCVFVILHVGAIRS